MARSLTPRVWSDGGFWLLAAALLSAGCGVVADGHNVQGVRAFESGNYAHALQRFQDAATTDPQNADSVYNMAATLHRQGLQTGNRDLLNQAEVLYNQSLDVDSGHVHAYRGLAVLLVETDRPDKAFKLMKNWIAARPQDANARIELARLYEEFGDLASAKIHLLDAMQLDPANPRAHLAFGHIREREGDYSQALANYQRSYSLNQDPSTRDRMASLSRSSWTGGTSGSSKTQFGLTPDTASSSRLGQRINSRGWNARY